MRDALDSPEARATSPNADYAFGWPSSIATIALGVLVSIGLVVQLGRRTTVTAMRPSGVWESRTPVPDGGEVTRRIYFTGARQGTWTEVRTSRGVVTSADSLSFALEGPRANRFCMARTSATADCRILQMAGDSLTMMFGTPTVQRPAGQTRLVFVPSR